MEQKKSIFIISLCNTCLMLGQCYFTSCNSFYKCVTLTFYYILDWFSRTVEKCFLSKHYFILAFTCICPLDRLWMQLGRSCCLSATCPQQSASQWSWQSARTWCGPMARTPQVRTCLSCAVVSHCLVFVQAWSFELHSDVSVVLSKWHPATDQKTNTVIAGA